ncbi:hypothetical protein ACFSX9_09775 [Flavobacterium ardleyense]|uniref:Lipoprotein n=1 Tax=Flavobacterium ardleyense TaxID=2038737 RepID=A0ABW5Z986_9FLAO
MIKNWTYFILTIGLISCGPIFDKPTATKPGEIEVTWDENLTGDFSFKNNWDYPEGIYRNQFDQLSSDGLCPSEIDRMKDENGKIYEDSLKAFYQIVDTTYKFHTIQSEASTYEWAGTNFTTATKISTDTTICFTHSNVATHSNLLLTITNNKCIPTIEVNSVAGFKGKKSYKCKSGLISIDKKLWEKGVLKAKFDFIFDHPEYPSTTMYWRGKIHTTIENN